MFNLDRIDFSNFGKGIVPKFNVGDLNIQKIKYGFQQSKDLQRENQKVIRSANDMFNAINRRYNKFKYAYYNKGVKSLDKEKINRCYKKTRRFLIILQHMHQKLIASGDPRADNFGKKLAYAHEIVQKYGGYVMRLNQQKCAVRGNSKHKISNSRNKIRK